MPGHRTVLAAGRAATEFGHCVRAVETYHMVKLGNNIKLLSFSRVSDRKGLVEDYEGIISSDRNPLFRAARMRALLLEHPWHWGMNESFAEYPHPFFLEIEGKTPKYLPRFGRDARELFAAHRQGIRNLEPDEMNDDEKLKHLGQIVRRMIVSYVDRKAAKKLGLDYDKDFKSEVNDGKKRKVAPKGRADEFCEQQRRVCNDAFLQIRSRHDEDFVQFFTDSILSVPNYLNAKTDDYTFVAQALMTPPPRDAIARSTRRNRDDIKTLAMLALSAHSFNIRTREPKKEGSPS